MIKRNMILTQLIGCLCFLISHPSLSQSADVTLTVGDGSGFKGSHNNPVVVSLNNPSHEVTKVVMEVCEVDVKYLTVTGCETTSRTDDFSCSAFQWGKCAKVDLESTGGLISSGTGAIFTLKYNVSETAPTDCKDLSSQDIGVWAGEAFLSVDAVTGNFCFNECSTNPDCDDGLYCNGPDTCSAGVCYHLDNPCPEDGLFCTICDEEGENCYGNPCPPEGEPEKDICFEEGPHSRRANRSSNK